MISRDALYSFVENLISSAVDGDALFGAEAFRNLRTSVDEATKIVRVECFTGQHVMTVEDVKKEHGVTFTIQCWVIPDDDTQTAIDAASDLSFEMSRAIFEAIASDSTGLGGKVCDAYANEFETGEANLGTLRRGVTFLDGIINAVG